MYGVRTGSTELGEGIFIEVGAARGTVEGFGQGMVGKAKWL
jgi:hypothetical protein